MAHGGPGQRQAGTPGAYRGGRYACDSADVLTLLYGIVDAPLPDLHSPDCSGMLIPLSIEVHNAYEVSLALCWYASALRPLG